MTSLPTTANRTAALGAQERKPCTVLDVTVDKCANAYGATPCTAGRVQSAQTALASALQSLTLSATASAVADAYKNNLLRITAGAGAGQERTVLTSRKNLALYSEDMTGAAWSGAYVVTANAAYAPDGRLTADKVACTAAPDYRLQGCAVGAAAGGRTFTYDVWLWTDAGQSTHALLYLYGSLTYVYQVAIVLTTTPVRYKITATINALETATSLNIRAAVDVGNYMYQWGNQLVEGQQAEYVSTGAAAAVGAAVAPWSNNALLRSDELDNAAWVSRSAFVTVAPNDDGIAEKFTVGTWPGAGAQTIIGTQNLTPVSAKFTHACEVRQGVGRYVQACIFDAAGGGTYQVRVNFDLLNNTASLVQNTGSVYVAAGISVLADGYHRCWVALNLPTLVAMTVRGMQFCDAAANAFGDTSGMYHWVRHQQLAQGWQTDPPYMATTSAAIAPPDATSVYDMINRPNACYNTYETCQAKTAYVKTTQTITLVSRGVQSPLTESLRPYLLGSVSAPANLDFEAGLAARNNVSVSLADETDNDSSQDPYFATRATPAGGTFWARWLARNKNYFGRPAKLRKGFVADPWDWTLFLDELYIIDSMAFDNNGQVKITLKDPLKLTDNNTVPLPTSGAIQSDTKAIDNSGLVVAAASNTVTLATTASALDGYYVGMEVYIYANTGAGQRRIVSTYVGATRVATLSVAWSVLPDTTSAYQASPLSVTLDAGKGAQYADPATSGKAEYIRINSEIIRYTAKVGDVLSWPDATYRAQFGSTAGNHSAGDSVQLCRAWINQPIASVLTSLLTESGIAAGYVGTSLAAECATWYGSLFNITACISAPEQASIMLAEILQQIGATMWWSPQTQLVEFAANNPSNATYPTWSDTGNIMQGSLSVKNLDTLRITEYAVSYALRDATANLSEPRSFRRTDVVVNANAESTNEYGDVRPQVVTSRWFGLQNAVAMLAVASRQIHRRYNAPKLFTLKIDPKDYSVPIAGRVGIQSYKNADYSGNAKAELCFVTQMDDRGTHIEVQARSANFASRYGYIAAAGAASYPTETTHAHICSSAGKMGNGDDPYRII